MKNLHITSYILRTKWIALIIVSILLIILARTVHSPALTQTAVVLGIGIDYSQIDNFTVSTQSVVVSGSSATSGGANSSFVTYTEKGKTIASALDSISQKMGLIISLAHCNVVYLSKSALDINHLHLVDALTGMYSLPEQALIVSGEKSPKELIAARIGTTISAPFYLQTTLIKHEGSDGIVRTTVKDFMARSLSRSGANVLPYITLQTLSDQPMDSQGQKEDNMQYTMKQALVCSQSTSEVISEELTEILAIYSSTQVVGSLNYTSKNGESFEFKILDSKLSKKVKDRKVEAKIELSVDQLDVQFVNGDINYSGADKMILDAADALAKELTTKLSKLFELSKKYNVDFLNLQTAVYQKAGRKLEKNCLNTISFEPNIEIKVKEAA